MHVAENSFTPERALPEFREAFAEYGLRPDSTAPDDVAARLGGRPAEVRGRAVAALNGWVFVAALNNAPEAGWLERALASADPDGLERVAQDLGFLDRGLDAPYQIIPDYTIPFLGETALSTIVAGVIGALVVAAVAFGITRLIRRRPAQPAVKAGRSVS